MAKAKNPTTTPLRASAKPITREASAPTGDDDELPTHTDPFQAFDWVGLGDDAGQLSPAESSLRSLVNDTINVCSGVALTLRILEQCSAVGELSPELVRFSDGSEMEQPEVPYLSPGQCSELGAMAATASALLVDQAHRHAQWLREMAQRKARRA